MAQARHAEYGGGHGALNKHQPGAVTEQAKYGAHDDPGQHQGTDHIKSPMADGTDGHAQGRERQRSRR